jgi:hypothetical protein
MAVVVNVQKKVISNNLPLNPFLKNWNELLQGNGMGITHEKLDPKSMEVH